jgi:hypothetical protein
MDRTKNRVGLLVVVLAVVIGLLSCGTNGLIGKQQPSATPTKTPRPTFTPTLTPSLTPLPSNTPLPTSTSTPVPPTNTPIVLTATFTPLPTETATAEPPTNTPPPTTKPTSKPTTKPAPTKTKTPIPPPTNTPAPQYQWSGQLVWDPAFSPQCDGIGVAKQSVIKDKAGSALNGVVVLADCYGNKMYSVPSGKAGVYDPGHYDFYPFARPPQAYTCTLQIWQYNGQGVSGSQVVEMPFNTTGCKPGAGGHQMAIVNWTKNY